MAEDKAAREAGFERLGRRIYLKRPLATVQTLEGTQNHPTIILFFGWMGAKLPHLLKYTQAYDKLYPSATQILVRCEAATFWIPESIRRTSISPAVEALAALGGDGARDGTSISQHRILTHTFSNGGCFQLSSLAKYLSQHSCTNVTTGAIIFDSCPGTGSLGPSVRAFSSVVRFAPLRYLITFILSFYFFFGFIMRRLFHLPLFWETMRSQLNQPRFLPWMRESSPRLYVYSTSDELVPWPEVESHAKEAEKSFTDIRMERFEKSSHVAHMREDPERYWGAVQALWDAACKAT